MCQAMQEIIEDVRKEYIAENNNHIANPARICYNIRKSTTKGVQYDYRTE